MLRQNGCCYWAVARPLNIEARRYAEHVPHKTLVLRLGLRVSTARCYCVCVRQRDPVEFEECLVVRTAVSSPYHLPRGAFRGSALCVEGWDVSSRASALARIFGIMVLSRDLILG